MPFVPDWLLGIGNSQKPLQETPGPGRPSAECGFRLFIIDNFFLDGSVGPMDRAIREIINAIHKGAHVVLDTVHKGAMVSLRAVQKGSTVSGDAIHKGATASVKAMEIGTAASVDFLDAFSTIRGKSRSVLNGVIGDMLEAHDRGLAIEMELLGEATGDKLCVFVHGLCDSEEAWKISEEPDLNYGSRLQKDLGYPPLYLRYNTGLHISTNGRRLAKILNDHYKENPFKELIFIGHSMGGLVVRSACYYGQEEDHSWVKRVKKIFLLGTPHHGTDWEKIGNLTSAILKKVPNLVTKGLAILGNKRSAGIKDLRFGYLLDKDWKGHDPDALLKDNRTPVPLMDGVDYYILTATLAKESENIFVQYFGDGAVPTRSAMGHSLIKSKAIPFPKEHLKSFKGIGHVKLLHHPRVYQQIKKWCKK